MAKQWQMFDDECLHCGSPAEVFTATGKDNWASDGDEARCTACGCPGTVGVEDTIDNDGASIDWHDEPDCSCDWCKSHPADDTKHGGASA